MNVVGVRDHGCVFKGDVLKFNLFLFIGEGAMTSFEFPVNSVLKASLPGSDAGIVTTTDITITNNNGICLIKFSKEQTVLLKAGQPTLVFTVTADDYCQTFECRLPFSIKARALGV